LRKLYEAEFNFKPFGKELVELLLARYQIKCEFLDEISENFYSILDTVGEVVAGDEKLLHFTGNSGFIRMVPNNPDRVGLWYFELACRLESGDPYMIHVKLSTASKDLGISVPIEGIVITWAEIASSFEFCPVLIFDSY